MIIKKQDQNKLIQELLPQLLEVNEQSVAYSRMKGEDMIAQGQTHIGKSTVDPRGNYTVSRVVFLKVNHEKRMKKLIRDAKNYEDMTSRLGAYHIPGTCKASSWVNPVFFE